MSYREDYVLIVNEKLVSAFWERVWASTALASWCRDSYLFLTQAGDVVVRGYSYSFQATHDLVTGTMNDLDEDGDTWRLLVMGDDPMDYADEGAYVDGPDAYERRELYVDTRDARELPAVPDGLQALAAAVDEQGPVHDAVAAYIEDMCHRRRDPVAFMHEHFADGTAMMGVDDAELRELADDGMAEYQELEGSDVSLDEIIAGAATIAAQRQAIDQVRDLVREWDWDLASDFRRQPPDAVLRLSDDRLLAHYDDELRVWRECETDDHGTVYADITDIVDMSGLTALALATNEHDHDQGRSEEAD